MARINDDKTGIEEMAAGEFEAVRESMNREDGTDSDVQPADEVPVEYADPPEEVK